MLLEEEVKENRDVFKVFLQFTLWTFIFILLVFVYIWQNIIISDFEYKIKTMEKQIKVLSKEKQEMETEISFLGSPRRIGEIAEKKLKLIPVHQEDIIWIDYRNQPKQYTKKLEKSR